MKDVEPADIIWEVNMTKQPHHLFRTH